MRELRGDSLRIEGDFKHAAILPLHVPTGPGRAYLDRPAAGAERLLVGVWFGDARQPVVRASTCGRRGPHGRLRFAPLGSTRRLSPTAVCLLLSRPFSS